MNKSYNLHLNGILIGTSELEKGDPPMGVVLGELKFTDSNFGYDFIKKFCLEKNIELAYDYPEDKMISTMAISELKVTNENGIEITGIGNQISGMDNAEYEIEIFGIPYPFYEEEFPHHVAKYKTKFNEK